MSVCHEYICSYRLGRAAYFASTQAMSFHVLRASGCHHCKPLVAAFFAFWVGTALLASLTHQGALHYPQSVRFLRSQDSRWLARPPRLFREFHSSGQGLGPKRSPGQAKLLTIAYNSSRNSSHASEEDKVEAGDARSSACDKQHWAGCTSQKIAFVIPTDDERLAMIHAGRRSRKVSCSDQSNVTPSLFLMV
jgi:hypothetical protein